MTEEDKARLEDWVRAHIKKTFTPEVCDKLWAEILEDRSIPHEKLFGKKS